MEDLITQIEANRLLLNLSKRDLCKAADITPEYYHKIITGQAKGCSHYILKSLCDVTGILLQFAINPAFLTKFNQKTKKRPH